VVVHRARAHVRAVSPQHFNYGRGILTFRLIRRVGRSSFIPEPLRFYVGLVMSLMLPSPVDLVATERAGRCSQLATSSARCAV
jgi:hypothetical protein